MPFRDAANAWLQRATGLRLTRETPQQRREAIANARRAGAADARERYAERDRRRALEQEARRAERLAERKHKTQGDRLPVHLDEVKRDIIKKVSPRTMTGLPKLDPLVEAIRYITLHRIPGDIVECGVWRGGSMQAMALTLLSLGDTSRELHLFDTFEGMPAPTAEDTRKRSTGEIVAAADTLASSDRSKMVWAVAGIDDVREGMAETGYPADKIHYHVGMVEDTTPGEAPEQIAILRLDTDWYASTRHELETLYERLRAGGVLMIDDYADWDGARKATDEWLETTGEVLFLAPMGPGRIAVKPVAGGPQYAR